MDHFIKDEKDKILKEIADAKEEVKKKATRIDEMDKKGNKVEMYVVEDPVK